MYCFARPYVARTRPALPAQSSARANVSRHYYRRGDALILNLLRYHQELRSSDEFNLPSRNVKNYKVTNREIDMAEQLVEAMTVDWAPQQYRDEYREALMQWIEKKAQAGNKAAAPEPETEEPRGGGGAEIIDMMALLKKSVKQSGGSGTTSGRAKTKQRVGLRAGPSASQLPPGGRAPVVERC
jgi:non-homologous end joining protein Ku